MNTKYCLVATYGVNTFYLCSLDNLSPYLSRDSPSSDLPSGRPPILLPTTIIIIRNPGHAEVRVDRQFSSPADEAWFLNRARERLSQGRPNATIIVGRGTRGSIKAALFGPRCPRKDDGESEPRWAAYAEEVDKLCGIFLLAVGTSPDVVIQVISCPP